METSQERIERTGRVLVAWLDNDDQRVQYATRRRRAMLRAMEEGGKIDGYEISTWIKTTARELLDTMMQRAHEYNGKCPWDRVRREDLTDVVQTTLGLISS
jgi:hypothetical protein